MENHSGQSSIKKKKDKKRERKKKKDRVFESWIKDWKIQQWYTRLNGKISSWWRCGGGNRLVDGGGKYSTPGAGVIIYLAPEIGLADTAGRFNGRTMLELTKTKTKHQLGDFFFHHLPVCLLGLKVLLRLEDIIQCLFRIEIVFGWTLKTKTCNILVVSPIFSF